MSVLTDNINNFRNLSLREKEVGLTTQEKIAKEESFLFLARLMEKHISFLIAKDNYLPGMNSDDIKQELLLQLLDAVLPRLSKRKDSTGTFQMIKVVDTNLDDNKIYTFLCYSLSQKYIRLIRNLYSHNNKKKGDNSDLLVGQEFLNPLNNSFISLGYSSEENDENDLFYDVSDNGEFAKSVEAKIQVNSLIQQTSGSGKKILTMALNRDLPKSDFTAFVRKGEARKSIQQVKKLLQVEYGVKQEPRRTRQKRQLSSTQQSAEKNLYQRV